MFELRPYQEKFINDIHEQFCELSTEKKKLGRRGRVCGVMPCGAGKTLATAYMTKKAAEEKGRRVVFMVHRKELIEQTSKTFTDLEIEHGIIASGVKPNYDLPVQIASVQTLARRLDKIPPPQFLIVDECHHIEAETYKQIVNKWDCVVLGLTATPVRMGGRTLHDSFDVLVPGSTVNELIQIHCLAEFKYFAPPSTINFQKLRLNEFGDFRDDDMSRALDRQDIIGDVVKYYREHADGLQAIVYCVNVHHSKHTSKIFNEAGISAQHIDAKTPSSERRDIIEKFRAGEITVLCNVNLFGEGFDVPNMDCVILTRPTKSFTLYYQQAMRALRPNRNDPSKKAIIIDHVENNTRFPMLDEDIPWSLNPNKLKGKGIMPIKTCPECGEEEVPFGRRTCQRIIANHESIQSIERKDKTLSIVYRPSEPLTRRGYLVLAESKTASNLEFVNNKSDIIFEKKIKRRCVAEIDQSIYEATNFQTSYCLTVKCIDESVSLKDATISRADGTSGMSPVLCAADGRVLKYFLDLDGNLVCGHIFNIRNTDIDEDGIIVKVYDSAQSDKSKIIYPFNRIVKRPTSIEELLRIAEEKKISNARWWASKYALEYVQSYEDCLHIARVCEYKSGWAWHKWKELEPKRRQMSLDFEQ